MSNSIASSWSKLSKLHRVSANPFCLRIFYFLSLSLLGFCVLKALKPSTHSSDPRNLDLFFTSVSVATLSSMSTVEMENFSNSQLIVMTIMMFISGEVFISMTTLFISYFKPKLRRVGAKVDNASSLCRCDNSLRQENIIPSGIESGILIQEVDHEHLMHHSIKFLSFVVLGYLLVVNLVGAALVSLYLSFVSSARSVLKSKGLKLITFSFFTTFSSFTNCGFVPTNENMAVFIKNPGLLLIIIPQILLGNTLYPACLRFTIWVLGKLVKKVEKNSNFLLSNTKEIGYPHLFQTRRSWCLVITVFGFLVIQLVLCFGIDWNLDSLNGLNSFRKIIALLFQSINARHAGESVVDLSTVSAAILVLVVVFMYLPPYATFLFANDEDKKHRQKKGLSQLAYLSIFVIIICITERQNMKEDPLNFSIFNIVLEVVSAYGNVGFTMGYSCKRRLITDGYCEDKWYGFVGRWSDAGKTTLIAVMIFGRLKTFNMTWNFS